jgi:hypothetical protein
MRMRARADGHVDSVFLAECLRKATGLVAGDAPNLDVGYFTRGTDLIQPKVPRTLDLCDRLLTMRERDPRKVVEVPVLAGDDEARWQRGGRRLRVLAVRVYVTVTVRTERVDLELEEARFDRGELAADGAEQPSREGSDRNADEPSSVESRERESTDILGLRGPVEPLDCAQPLLLADLCKQARLLDYRGVIEAPVVETHHHR